MEKISDIGADWQGLQEFSELIEKLLNEIIHNENLSVGEMRENAALCLKAINGYTEMTNQNVHLLHEQTKEMLKRVQTVLEESQKEEPKKDDDTEFDIH